MLSAVDTVTAINSSPITTFWIGSKRVGGSRTTIILACLIAIKSFITHDYSLAKWIFPKNPRVFCLFFRWYSYNFMGRAVKGGRQSQKVWSSFNRRSKVSTRFMFARHLLPLKGHKFRRSYLLVFLSYLFCFVNKIWELIAMPIPLWQLLQRHFTGCAV